MKLEDKKNETLELHTAPIQSLVGNTSVNHMPRHEETSLRAYEIYLERGGRPGNELDDWLQAERELDRAVQPNVNRFSVNRETP